MTRCRQWQCGVGEMLYCFVLFAGYVHNKLGDQDLAMGKLSEALKLDSSFFEAYRGGPTEHAPVSSL